MCMRPCVLFLVSLVIAHASPAWAESPAERAARILAELDTSGPFIVSTEGDQLNLAIWWVNYALVVTRDGELVPDAVTAIEEDGRLSFAGAFDAQGHATLRGTIDRPLDTTWLVFALESDGAAPVSITPDLLIGRCSIKKCRCGGTGGTVTITCTAANCRDNTECRKKDQSYVGYCQDFYGETPCAVTPSTPIPVEEVEP
jgi:hypothetical protein